MTIGERLKAARKKRNMSQSQVATALGISQELVAKLEAGERQPGERLGAINRWIASGRGANDAGPQKRGAYRSYDSSKR